MSTLEVLGWAGNACFFSRWLIQWFFSERAKKSVAPAAFWWVSLLGTATLGTYTFIKGEPILLVGFAVNVAIYTRNLALLRTGEKTKGWSGWQLALICVVVAFALVAVKFTTSERFQQSTPAWNAFGIIGLAIWNSRWGLQWWYSEKKSMSHFPPVFWWVSLLGNTMLLAYAIHVGEAVWIASYALGPVIQTRNVILNRRHLQAERLAEAPTTDAVLTPAAPLAARVAVNGSEPTSSPNGQHNHTRERVSLSDRSKKK